MRESETKEMNTQQSTEMNTQQFMRVQEQLYDRLMKKEKNPLQILEEMRRHLDDNYVVVKTDHKSAGPPHRPIHRIRLTFGDYSAIGIGYNLKMATHLAAHIISKEIQPLLEDIAKQQRQEKKRYQEFFDYVDMEMHTCPYLELDKKELNRVVCASDLSENPTLANELQEALMNGTDFGIDMEGTMGRYGGPSRLVQISVFNTKETWLIRHIDNETDYHPILRDFFEDPYRTKYVFGEGDDLGPHANNVVDVVTFLNANDRQVMCKVFDRNMKQHPSLCDMVNLMALYKIFKDKDLPISQDVEPISRTSILRVFKNKELTLSNWSDPSGLRTDQVMYAAADARATLAIGRYFAARI